MNTKLQDIFSGRKLVIATMHGKEKIIWPLLEKNLWVKIIVPSKFNSDTFGTFTREIKRDWNQIEAAKSKLLAAMQEESIDLWIASEWSFWPHPACPFIPWNFELVLLIDLKNNYELTWVYRTYETNFLSEYISNFHQAKIFAQKIWFPEHGIILRNNEKDMKNIWKDISNFNQLKEVTDKLLSKIFTKKIFIETDMRAHKNPTRMKAIKYACENLLTGLQSFCPSCKSPGYIISNIEKWLLCSQCKSATELPKYNISICKSCNYTLKEENKDYGSLADPGYCNYCNP